MKIQYKQKFTINRKAEILSNYDFIYIYIYIYEELFSKTL